MTQQIRRVRYSQGQFLGADDLQAEQDYHRGMRRRHQIGHHTWGVVTGLDLELEGDDRLWVGAGMAVDGFGREIVVLADVELAPADFLAEDLTTGLQPVWLAYDEDAAVSATYGYAECEDDDRQRIVELHRVVVGTPSDPDGRDDVIVAGESIDTGASIPYQELPEDDAKARWYVLLGEVFWDRSTSTFTSVDLSKRRHVGVVAEAVWAPAGRLTVADRRATPDLEVTVQGELQVDERLTAKGDVELHGSELVALNSDGGGERVSLGRADPGGSGGADLTIEVGKHPDSTKANRFAVQSEGSDRLTVEQDGTTDIHGDTTIRDESELRLDGGHLGITRKGTSPASWIVRQADPADGDQLEFRETINEAATDGRVVLEILDSAGNLGDAVLRLQGASGATLSATQLIDLTDGGFTTLHQHAFATTTTAGRVEIATPGETTTNGSSGARVVLPADDPRILTQFEHNELTDGGTTTLHAHSSTFINETRSVQLQAEEGMTSTSTVTLPGQRRVFAAAMLVGTEEGYGTFGATEYGDAFIEIHLVNGSQRPTWFFDGRNLGPNGSATSLKSPVFVGLATSVSFRLRAFTGLAWGLGIVFYENP